MIVVYHMCHDPYAYVLYIICIVTHMLCELTFVTNMCLFYPHLQYPHISIKNSDWEFSTKQCTHTCVPKERHNICQILQYPHIGLQKRDSFFVKQMQYLCVSLQSNRYWLTCLLHLIYHIRVLHFGIGFWTNQSLWTIYQIMEYPHIGS
jgi:hypothetical protein